MKIGVCVKNAEDALIAEQAGYDFVEVTVVSLQPENEEMEFKKILEGYQKLTIPVRVCNVFLPGDLKVVGEEVDRERINNYVASALSRVKEIGADTVVFGSGGARSYPENLSKEKAVEQIVEFLKIVAPYAEKNGITIVIEPLNKKESNIINSVAEGADFVQKINHPSIQLLADFYHMDEDNESLAEIVKYKKYIKHIHLADTGRHQPGTGKYPYATFVNCLQEANYNERVSIESNWTEFNLEELEKSLQYVQEQFNQNKVKNA